MPSSTTILWQSVLGEIELAVSGANFTTWFKETSLIDHEGGQLIVGVPSIFAKRHLEDKFHNLILKTLKRNGIEAAKIEYRVQPAAPRASNQDSRATDLGIAPIAKPPVASAGLNQPQPAINPRYTFDNFVVGTSNELAYTATQAVAREPGIKYNPLFIYGGVGLGKTHLIQALGNALAQRSGDLRVEYVTCERFFKEFVASILGKRPFSNRYRSADVLIVDDMQFIAGKEKAQEEFFHTFNTLFEANKQIVISSDRPPKAIATLEDRLRSRFDSGMSTDIQPPDYETRIAILQAKINQARRTVPPEVTEYLARRIESNIRELEGALTKLFAHCEMRGLVPSLELVEQMTSPPVVKSRRIDPKIIIDKTARYFSINADQLTSPRRDKQVAEPRQIAMYLMRTELQLSYPQIARQVGRSDHTTAIHSIHKIEKSLLNNQHLRRSVYELKEKLYV